MKPLTRLCDSEESVSCPFKFRLGCGAQVRQTKPQVVLGGRCGLPHGMEQEAQLPASCPAGLRFLVREASWILRVPVSGSGYTSHGPRRPTLHSRQDTSASPGDSGVGWFAYPKCRDRRSCISLY